MRRESSTVVALVGGVDDGLVAGLARSPNVAVARPAATEADAHSSDGDNQKAATARPGWELGALAMRQAARLRATYVVVPVDPLADVAAEWRAMWNMSGELPGAAGFEARAAAALTAWRDKQFELPDYYIVVAPAAASGTGPDFYLGPLRGLRPHRIAVAGVADGPGSAEPIADALRSLQHGPWWPPLDELLDAARRFYAGGLTETQLSTI
ncbi:MAG: hypothetical protein ACLQFR_02270 [Streptosporangiaceae bacterium]